MADQISEEGIRDMVEALSGLSKTPRNGVIELTSATLGAHPTAVAPLARLTQGARKKKDSTAAVRAPLRKPPPGLANAEVCAKLLEQCADWSRANEANQNVAELKIIFSALTMEGALLRCVAGVLRCVAALLLARCVAGAP